MQLTSRAYLVGSGRLGLTLTDPYDCNVFLIDGGTEAALVDAGAGHQPAALLASIERRELPTAKLTKVLLTHKHADHSGGAAAIRDATGAELYASALTADTIRDGERVNAGLDRARASGSYPADYVYRGADVDVTVAEGEEIEVGDLVVEVIETPGHCAGHCSFAYREEGRSVLITGDAVLPLGQVVLQPIADCSVVESVASIEKLASRSWDVMLPGHLGPVLDEADWHLQTAVSRLRQGRLPSALYIPEAQEKADPCRI
jgi:glyoxylase-like metal-dependent hydrolase (beta-lactamase superfamily II)